MEGDSRRQPEERVNASSGAEVAAISAEAPSKLPIQKLEDVSGVEQPSQDDESTHRWTSCRDKYCCHCYHQATTCLNTTVDRYPRTCAIFCRILLPLTGLFFLAVIGGSLLGAVEAPNEIVTNNRIAASRFVDEQIDLLEWIETLEDIPTFCLNFALNQTIVDAEQNITLVRSRTPELRKASSAMYMIFWGAPPHLIGVAG